MPQEINYKDILDLGFEEHSSNDSVYFDQYGYDYTWHELNVVHSEKGRIYFHWSRDERIVKLIRVNQHDEIQSKLIIPNLKTLRQLVKFFTGTK